MADVRAVRLAHLPDSISVFAALFKDVTNAAFLRRQLVEANTEFEYAFLDASAVSLYELMTSKTSNSESFNVFHA